MIAYFAASVVGKKQYEKNYNEIIDILNKKDIKVLSDHVMKVTEEDIRFNLKTKRIAFQKKLEEWIASANCVIAEVSFPSISVGYEISLAIHMGKPVLMLYCDETPPTFLIHQQDEKLLCEEYCEGNLEETLKEFINYVEGTRDARFTFFITSEIASYLERVSKEQKLPKSVYLRKLIEKDMASKR